MTQNTSQHAAAGAPSGRVCYLHIGPHKTGTTSIQNALFSNAERLEAIGLYYPTLSGDRPGRQRRNHTPLSRHAVLRADDLRTAPFWGEISEKITTIAEADGSIIISTEHFADSLRDEARFEKVTSFFHDHGFRIVAVAYVRDQPGWLNSWYTQDQRNFISRQSFAEFLDNALETGLVDPWAFLRRFIDDERIEVRVVSFEQAIKQGLAKSFLNAIGAPADFDIPEPQASNPNLGVKGMYAAQEIMRRVDVRVRSMPNYADLYESFKLMMKGRDWEKTAYVGVSPESEKRIRDHYRASNDAFARQWFGADWETICPPRPMTLREFDYDAATDAEKRELIDVVDGMVNLIQGAPQAAKGGGKKPKGGAGGRGGQRAKGLKGSGKAGAGKAAARGAGSKAVGSKAAGSKAAGSKAAGSEAAGSEAAAATTTAQGHKKAAGARVKPGKPAGKPAKKASARPLKKTPTPVII